MECLQKVPGNCILQRGTHEFQYFAEKQTLLSFALTF